MASINELQSKVTGLERRIMAHERLRADPTTGLVVIWNNGVPFIVRDGLDQVPITVTGYSSGLGTYAWKQDAYDLSGARTMSGTLFGGSGAASGSNTLMEVNGVGIPSGAFPYKTRAWRRTYTGNSADVWEFCYAASGGEAASTSGLFVDVRTREYYTGPYNPGAYAKVFLNNASGVATASGAGTSLLFVNCIMVSGGQQIIIVPNEASGNGFIGGSTYPGILSVDSINAQQLGGGTKAVDALIIGNASGTGLGGTAKMLFTPGTSQTGAYKTIDASAPGGYGMNFSSGAALGFTPLPFSGYSTGTTYWIVPNSDISGDLIPGLLTIQVESLGGYGGTPFTFDANGRFCSKTILDTTTLQLGGLSGGLGAVTPAIKIAGVSGVSAASGVGQTGVLGPNGNYFAAGVCIALGSGSFASPGASGLAASGSITSGSVFGYFGPVRNIASGTVGVFDLGSGAVIAGQIGSGAVGSGQIGSGQVASGHLASGLLANIGLTSGGGGSGFFASGSVPGFFGPTRVIQSGTIGGFDFGSGAIIAGSVGSGAVISGNIASGQIGVGHIANGGVQSGSIASGQIGWAHLASGAVRSGQIGTAAIMSGNIASGQIGLYHLASGVLTAAGDPTQTKIRAIFF